MSYEYTVTIKTDEQLGQFFESSLEMWLESPQVNNDQTPSDVEVNINKETFISPEFQGEQ